MHSILHCISAYPDPVGPETRASAVLLALTRDRFDHHVFSFKRAGWRGPISAVGFDDAAGTGHRAMVYGAPPRGLRLAGAMNDLADWIIADATARGLRPDLVHAHKVSMDGLVGARVAAHFGVPLALSVQANSDTRIIAARRDLRAAYRALWQDAAVVFPFAPAAQTAIEPLVGKRAGPVRILPCPTNADSVLAPRPRAEGAVPVILTAFNLAHHANKNIRALLEATALAARDVPDIRLDIAGGGDAAAFLKVSQMVNRIAPQQARLLGAQDGTAMQARMNEATAFAMPSLRESYGMVYAESLLAGTPCLHSRGRAIDGLLPEGEMTLGCDPADVPQMAAALVRLCREEAAFKARIALAQDDGRLEFLRRGHIAATYAGAIDAALHQSLPDAA
jgi:glycosyltransferase involved in cell wall biosynthesis